MDKIRTADDWASILILCGCKETIAEKWSPIFSDTIKTNTFSRGDEELDDFLGQILHESAYLSVTIENLNYSAAGLRRVWPNRFSTIQIAEQFQYKPEAIANRVYGGRMGNILPGDGWKYRGRTPIQITGKDAYLFIGDKIGQDLVSMPELLEQPHYGLEATIAWWESNVPDKIINDILKVSKTVNGGINGLRERTFITNIASNSLYA